MKKINFIGSILMLLLCFGCSQEELDTDINEQSIYELGTELKKSPNKVVNVADVNGKYLCTDCPDGVVLEDVIALKGISTESGSQFIVEVTYRGKVYTSKPITQINCTKQGKITTCDFSGFMYVYGSKFVFEGTHQFRDTPNEKNECHSFSGSWSGNFYNEPVSGVFVSDQPLCN